MLLWVPTATRLHRTALSGKGNHIRGPMALSSGFWDPIFVFTYALVLGRALPTFLEWRPTRGILVLRLVAIAMIVGGIAIIQLF